MKLTSAGASFLEGQSRLMLQCNLSLNKFSGTLQQDEHKDAIIIHSCWVESMALLLISVDSDKGLACLVDISLCSAELARASPQTVGPDRLY